MPAKIHKVELPEAERTYLAELLTSGVAPARKLRRAQILLKADQGAHGPAWTDAKISEAYGVCRITVETVRRNYEENGLERTLNRKKPDREYERCLDGEAEAHLIALACSEAPEGKAQWSIRLLTEQMITLGYVESVSRETIRKTLKKTNLSLG